MIEEFVRGDFKYVVRWEVCAEGVFFRVRTFGIDGQDYFGGFTLFQKSYDESGLLKRIDEDYVSLLEKPIEIVRLYWRLVKLRNERDGVLNNFMRDENISFELSQKIFSLIFDVHRVDRKLFSFVSSLSESDVEKMKSFKYFHSEVDENSFWSDFSSYELEGRLFQ
ncbi:hypothetical protein [Pseudomonas mangrovi]|jgi:hypothetical protein|uniref:Uncharacterized protein n=1 Tax=Pseudomonas mangrovi TaxID=2161748 RepID=A0A2T5P4V3_9PSED|nr:hypothetical protein [Pseudomonas mangrovi]PTU72744.1 hypothetical protein DBO85_18495 [Pseudomonas mangrovi]